MKNPHFLIIGQGAIGKPLAQNLAKNHTVTAIARSEKSYDQPVHFLQKDARVLAFEDVCQATHLAIIITPDAGKDRVQAYADSYLAVCSRLAKLQQMYPQWQPERVLFLSSTSVYGENGGEHIDERTQALPSGETARVLLAAENTLTAAFGDRAVIVRASGIYGQMRTRLIRQVVAGQAALSHHWTNRIMDSDLIAVLARILTAESVKNLYLATDFCPVTQASVFGYIADVLGVAQPKAIPSAPTGKQIISNLPKHWLAFADYKSGHQAILEGLKLDDLK